MGKKLALYAICKNEEKFVDRWIESNLNADYICVLDTGSTDGTYECLKKWQKKFKEKIILGQKKYDSFRFDTARNDSLELVPDDTDILVCTDLDELWENKDWVDVIKRNWQDDTTHMWYKYVWSHNEDGSNNRVFYYSKIHNKDYRWKHPVHEALPYIGKCEKGVNLFDILTLHHWPDPTKSRGFYLDLLKLRRQESNDSQSILYLAREYMFNHMYEESINTYFELTQTNAPDLEKVNAYTSIADCYFKMNEFDKAVKNAKCAIKMMPGYRRAYITLGKVYLFQKYFAEARAVLREGIKNSKRMNSWLEVDSYNYEIYDLLAQACFYCGYKLESIAYAAKALDMNKTDERLKKNLDVCIKETKDSELY